MSETGFHIEIVNPPSSDPDETVESPPEAELAPIPRTAAVVEGGEVGSATSAAEPLGATGLDAAALAVLEKRGIDPGALEGRGDGFESVGGGGGGGGAPLQDILEAAAPVAAGRRGGGAARAVVKDRELASALESIIWDADGDARVRINETDQYPYSAIAALEITARDGSMYVGTGWFVSPHTVITAGHCVFVRNASSPGANGWVRSIRVIPGRNGQGSGSEPFESVESKTFRSVKGWVSEGRPESDYGAILLPPGSRPNGSQVGVFGVGVFDDADLRRFSLNLAGYPADKTGSEAQTLWYDVKQAKRLTPKQVFYDVDTYGGQSGAPVYVTRGEQRIAVAVHAYGTYGSVTSNSGTRITPEVLQRIQSWKT